MDMHFPWPVILVFVLAMYWPATLAATCILYVAGALVRSRWVRVPAWTLAVLLTLVLLGVGGFLLYGKLDDLRKVRQAKAEQERLHVVLTAPTPVNGLTLPAGTRVQWTADDRTDVSSIDLPGPTRMLGFLLAGHLDRERTGENASYDVNLAEPVQSGTWPCGPGEAHLNANSIGLAAPATLDGCTLAREFAFRGLMLPQGTCVDLPDGLRLVMPDHRSMPLPGTGLDVPQAGVLELAEDGSYKSVQGSWRDTAKQAVSFTEAGVPFRQTLEMVRLSDLSGVASDATILGVHGTLDREFTCEKKNLFAGMDVSLFASVHQLWANDSMTGESHLVAGCPLR